MYFVYRRIRQVFPKYIARVLNAWKMLLVEGYYCMVALSGGNGD